MKRVNILWLLLNSLFLVVFNLLFFLFIDTSNFNTTIWISYGFIHFAYLLLLLTPFMVRKSSVSTNYRRPLYLITGACFIVELFVGIICILIAPERSKVAIILQTVLAALFLDCLLLHLIANEHTADKT